LGGSLDVLFAGIAAAPSSSGHTLLHYRCTMVLTEEEFHPAPVFIDIVNIVRSPLDLCFR
jgi:hypothetical protein